MFASRQVIKARKNFSNARFYYLSGIEIPEVSIRFMSCHEFSKEQHSTIILVRQSALVSYYISEVFSYFRKKGRSLR